MGWESAESAFTFDADSFEIWAEDYDLLVGESYDKRCITRIRALAGSDSEILELGAGTGRLAVPLALAGLSVHALDSSELMLKKLEARATAEGVAPGRIKTIHADMTRYESSPAFDVALIALNGLYLLESQDSQIELLGTVHRALRKSGRLIVEAFVPPSKEAFRFGQATNTTFLATNPAEVRLECSTHDPLEQRIRTQIVRVTPEGNKFYPVAMRYVYPSEFVLMAKLAGFAVEGLWGDWTGRPLSGGDGQYIGVLRKDGD